MLLLTRHHTIDGYSLSMTIQPVRYSPYSAFIYFILPWLVNENVINNDMILHHTCSHRLGAEVWTEAMESSGKERKIDGDVQVSKVLQASRAGCDGSCLGTVAF